MNIRKNKQTTKSKALTKEDWSEIYYALEYKRTSPAMTPAWCAHLESIMQKIGPDGENASGQVLIEV